ncbi:MAG: GNAT family N-acetyltransferase [Bdellovibrionales bacterium]|nr:GNAT family N-acetyltransferase [Bdellovibrionales bacterium]
MRACDTPEYVYQNCSDDFVLRVKKLAWDANIFGFSCARIEELWLANEDGLETIAEELQALKQILKQQQVRFCDVRVHSQAPQLYTALLKAGFKEVDDCNIYLLSTKDYTQRELSLSAQIQHELGEGDREQILSFGSSAFRHSRIFNDEHISEPQAIQFYEALLRSLLQKPKTYISTVKEDGKILGTCIGEIFTRNKLTKVAVLWAIAVSPGARGKGLSKILLHDFMEHFREQVEYYEIGTQANNVPANALYQGAQLTAPIGIRSLHYWN